MRGSVWPAVRWALAASKMLSVPMTLTFAPASGLSRQVGTCSAARWMMASGFSAATSASRAAVSSICTWWNGTLAISAGERIISQRLVVFATSSTTGWSPSSSRRLMIQVPKKPQPPVMRIFCPMSFLSKKASALRVGWRRSTRQDGAPHRTIRVPVVFQRLLLHFDRIARPGGRQVVAVLYHAGVEEVLVQMVDVLGDAALGGAGDADVIPHGQVLDVFAQTDAARS